VLIGNTQISDTFAEAFRLRFTRIVVTAHDEHWLDAAVRAACGYGTSVIGCDAEIGVERRHVLHARGLHDIAGWGREVVLTEELLGDAVVF
jgi:formylmethanofuran:tetrahydromethanopterin formyltransferase